MKKVIASIIIAIMIISFCGCRQADLVSYNISKEADSFNSYRRVTVIDCITNDTLFVVEGWISIQGGGSESNGKELVIIAEVGNNQYQKHMIGLSDNVTYTVEDLGTENVNKYKFNIFYNPKMWNPFTIEYTD